MHTFEPNSLNLKGASLLVTGATGSFGTTFVRKMLKDYKLRRLVVYSRDEMKQYEMAAELSEQDHPMLRYFIGDVRDRDRLALAMRDIDIVIHAAALKHVPTAEYNPFECIHTNVLGAENVVRAAIQAGVKKVIALSTDKAANPSNIYGASKLASDKIFTAANNLSGKDGTRFAVVRYGNVIGSRGSVVPLFQKMVREGATAIPITDERMTRFWITLDKGVNFVLSSLEMMIGGEIFVPKIPSMKVTDLARAIAPDLPTEVVGVRPGEKLHEHLITLDQARHTVDAGDRYIILPQFARWGRPVSPAEKKAKEVPDTFEYVSHTNQDWLDADGLRALLTDIGLA